MHISELGQTTLPEFQAPSGNISDITTLSALYRQYGPTVCLLKNFPQKTTQEFKGQAKEVWSFDLQTQDGATHGIVASKRPPSSQYLLLCSLGEYQDAQGTVRNTFGLCSFEPPAH